MVLVVDLVFLFAHLIELCSQFNIQSFQRFFEQKQNNILLFAYLIKLIKHVDWAPSRAPPRRGPWAGSMGVRVALRDDTYL